MTMVWIAGQTVTTGGGVTSVVFSSIPQTFTHLQLRVVARNTGANTSDNAYYWFNNDTGSNYTIHYLRGDGATASSYAIAPAGGTWSNILPGTSTLANSWGVTVTDILDYTNTNKNKTHRSLSGFDGNGSGHIYLYSGLWRNTAAISTITVVPNGGNLAQNSRFDLYGITTSSVTGA